MMETDPILNQGMNDQKNLRVVRTCMEEAHQAKANVLGENVEYFKEQKTSMIIEFKINRR